MLRTAIAFYVLSLVAIVLGASGAFGMTEDIGKVFMFMFLVMSGLAFIGAVINERKLEQSTSA